MSHTDTPLPVLDLTAKGVEFAAWHTEVESDELWLARVAYEEAGPLVTLVREGLGFSLPETCRQDHRLEATFISIERQAVIRFGFDAVVAYRVLDENGLTELWEASSSTPRPTGTTFRARGHRWAAESPLVFLDGGDMPRFSYFVVTAFLCLEVVCYDPPSVATLGPALVTAA